MVFVLRCFCSAFAAILRTELIQRPVVTRCLPPYSVGFVEKVVDKLIQTLNETEAEAFLLTNTDNSTNWYEKALGRCDRFILPHTRLTFYSPKRAADGKKQNQNRVSQTLFYFGLQPQKVEVVFRHWGTVCQTSKW